MEKKNKPNKRNQGSGQWLKIAGVIGAVAIAIPVALLSTRNPNSTKTLPGMDHPMPVATQPIQKTRSAHHGEPVEIVAAGQLPSFLLGTPAFIKEAYQFAVNNQDVLKNIPCYCGCGGMGHESNLSCYLDPSHKGDEKTVAWVGHSAGCDVCLNITQDVMKGLREGRSIQQIRDQVDKDYGDIAPGTPTPYPKEGA